MQRKQRGAAKATPAHSSESLLFRSLVGIVLIALGVVSALALLAPAQGNAFVVIRRVLHGVGGAPCIAIPVLLIWGGLLVAFSTRRRVPVRAILLLTGCYLCACGIINLGSKIGPQTFADYVLKLNNEAVTPNANGYWPMLSQSYRLCASSGSFGGFLGTAIAWPLWRYLDSVGGIIILSLLAVTCLMFVSRFDIVGWGKALRERSDQKLAQREQQRLEQEYLQQQASQAETVPVAQEEPRRSILDRFFRRDEPEPEPVPPQPLVPNMNQLAMQQAQLAYLQQQLYFSQMQQQQGQQPAQAGVPPINAPVVPAQTPRQVEMYDETIFSKEELEKATPWRRDDAKAAPKRKGKKQPLPVPEAVDSTPKQPEIDFPWKVEPPVAPSAKTSKRKTVDPQYEAMLRRKEELARELYPGATVTVQPAAAVTPAPLETTPAQPTEEAFEAYKRPVSIPEPKGQMTIPMSGKRLDEPKLILPEREATDDEPAKPAPTPYVYPTLNLLATPKVVQQDTRGQDAENAVKLEKVLQSFDVPARVQRVTHGPAVTRFELGLASSGINVKRIVNIADNIALEMAANGSVRIEVPIPGTNLFGIEVPNKEIASVSLAEVLTSPEMTAQKSPLAVALGKDIAGKPIICDLAKMPHLLIAGQTGSGKSVCINSIINSILYRATPEQVRMIMIDPKVVELQCYNVIPHLLIPVVSDPHKAAGALAWAVAEMLDRYQRIKSKNVRDINGYNNKLQPGEEAMCRIVIIVDELSDLMLACKREVEESIIRIAQLARAAGIHLVIATQRPTVNVITGLIKANVPSRIAFAVASNIDSRTILDANGADKLLGRGDMFYYPTGASAPMRVQGCFLSDEEIERVTDYIAAHTEPDFDPNILEVMESEGDAPGKQEENAVGDEGVDERLHEAIDMAIMDGQASISMLQRRMKIGYARAGRLIDDMAARGIVSKSAGSKPREVLITREEYERIKDAL